MNFFFVSRYPSNSKKFIFKPCILNINDTSMSNKIIILGIMNAFFQLLKKASSDYTLVQYKIK